jgi:hypothetical protein
MTSRTSWFQASERYFSAIRKISFVDSKVISLFNDEIKSVTEKIEVMLSDLELQKDNLFELRNLIYKLEDIVDIKVIQKYNEFIRSEVKLNSATELQKEKQDNVIVSDKKEIQSPKEVWSTVLDYLKTKLNVHTYNVWVKPITYDSCDQNNIKITVQNYFYKNWLEEHCSNLIKEHLETIKSSYKVTFVAN